MLALIQFNFVPLAIALLIGIVTARWMFADRRRGPANRLKDNSQS